VFGFWGRVWAREASAKESSLGSDTKSDVYPHGYTPRNTRYKPKIPRVKERDSTPPSKLGLTINKKG